MLRASYSPFTLKIKIFGVINQIPLTQPYQSATRRPLVERYITLVRALDRDINDTGTEDQTDGRCGPGNVLVALLCVGLGQI